MHPSSLAASPAFQKQDMMAEVMILTTATIIKVIVTIQTICSIILSFY